MDAKTGKSLPVSFPTLEATRDEAEMVVSVGGKGPREVRVTYVTDSPAWKPSYRLTFGEDPSKAELEAWAVVDNVSGEGALRSGGARRPRDGRLAHRG